MDNRSAALGGLTHQVQSCVHDVDHLQPLTIEGAELCTGFTFVAPASQGHGDRADGVACAADQMEELVGKSSEHSTPSANTHLPNTP